MKPDMLLMCIGMQQSSRDPILLGLFAVSADIGGSMDVLDAESDIVGKHVGIHIEVTQLSALADC